MKKFLIIACVFLSNAFAANHLPEALAFETSLVQDTPNTVKLEFKIANGHDIYADQIKIEADSASKIKLGKPVFPKPILIHNEVIGDYVVYKNNASIIIPVIDAGDGNLILNINFQGCKDLDYCYPTINRVLTLKLNMLQGKSIDKPVTTISNNTAPIEKPMQSGFMQNLLNGNSTTIEQSLNASPRLTILIFFVLGMLMSFTPCVFPMFPILLSIIAGKSNKKAVVLAVTYIIGSSCIYALTGVFVSYIGVSLQAYLQNIYAALFMALLLIIFSISLFGAFDIKLPNFITHHLHNHVLNRTSGSIFGVFIMGAVSTLILSPCVTAPLAGALIYISNSHNLFLGGCALFMLGIGIGLPLLIISLVGNRLLPKSGKWMIKVKQLLGLTMLLMAIYTLHGFLPLAIQYLLFGLWIMGLSFLIYTFLGNKVLRLFFSIIVFGLGGMLMVYPYINNITKISSSLNTIDNFTETVTNLKELDELLINDKSLQKIVILDYTAKWCLACREMELTTWQDNKLQSLMKNTINVKVDVSKNNKDSEDLEKRYQVFAPPAVIIIDKDGKVKQSFMGNTDAQKIANAIK